MKQSCFKKNVFANSKNGGYFNKNAFTLIELLAIIVILAIIAVITVPIILNVIENSKKGSVQDSALGYKDAVQKYYMNGLVENKNDELPSGIFLVSTLPSDFEVSGEKPTNDSWVQLEKGQVVAYSLKFGDYTVTKYKDSDLIIEKGNVQENNGESSNQPAAIPDPVAFSTDSWATIKKAIDEDNTNLYSVGDTKEVEIDLNQNGTIELTESYTVRLSNKTFDGCNTEANDFSQTACGYVFEFIDIIENNSMNSTDTNVGGWPASEMYAYLNDNDSTNEIVSIYEKLPSDLKSVIAETYTVSGHGSTVGEENFESMNKLYLLSRREILGGNIENDTAYDNTKQLKYYEDNASDSSKIKYTTASTPKANTWWIRVANSGTDGYFKYFYTDGRCYDATASNSHGVAPAFRIVKK